MTKTAAAPEPSRTLAVLFGASRWPEFETLDDEAAGHSYAAAAQDFRDYLLGEDGLGLPHDNLLDLFDSPAGIVDQDRQIRDFILRKCKETATIQDLVVMFVGHGSTKQNNKFIFVLRSTSRDQREITAYGSETLGRTLKKAAPRLRKWIILDCCAAAAAYGDFQPASEPEKILEEEAKTNFPPDGAAFYAACSSDNVAYNDPETGSRMFTAALTHVLNKGDATLSEHLTLSEVAALTLAEINRRQGPDAVRPYIGDPDQRKGELTNVPFFPNAARRTPAAEARLKLVEASVARLEESVGKRLDAIGQMLDEQRQRHEALAAQAAELATAPSPDPGMSDQPEGRAEIDDIRMRIRFLTLEDQRWWDNARSGYYTSLYLVAGCVILLAAAILFAALGAASENQASTYVKVQGGLGAVATLVGISCMTLMLGRRGMGTPANFERSPELDALLRTNEHFRKIYLGDYSYSRFGLLHNRMIAAAGLVSLVAALIGLTHFFLMSGLFPL